MRQEARGGLRRQTERDGPAGQQVASLGALAAVLVLGVGLAGLAVKRAGRWARVNQAT